MNTEDNTKDNMTEPNESNDMFADARKYVNDLFGKKEEGAAETIGELAAEDNSVSAKEAKLEEELTDARDRLLRANAEFDNYRKRTMKERMELLKTAGAEVIVAMLPVLDDFERAMKAMQQTQQTEALAGITLIYHKLKTTLEQKGLTVMETVDTDFDSDLHEALTTVPSDDESKKGKVVDEMEKGYYLGGKVIRHAKVVVGG